MSSIISLDSQAIESQQVRMANTTKANHAGMLRIIQALQKEMAAQRLLYLQAGTVRSKRRVILARRQDIIDKLSCEIDTMSMSCLEAHTLQTEFEQMRYHHARGLTDYVQYTEERLAVQKEKALIRMTGFAKNVIDDVNEEPGLPRGNRSHPVVHMLQTCMLHLASDGILPRNDHVDSLFQNLDEGPIDHVVMFNAMQLLDVLCSQNWAHGKNQQIDEQRSVVHRLIKLIPYAFTFVRTWNEDNCVRISLFVTQLFQTLRSTLNILQILGSVSTGTLPPPSNASNNRQSRDFGGASVGATFGSLTYGHSVSTASHDNSSTPYEAAVHYFEWCDSSAGSSSNAAYTDADLAADVTLWLKTFKYAKLGYFDAAEAEHTTILNTFCAPHVRVPSSLNRSTCRAPPTVQAYVTRELSIVLSLGSTLTTHAVQCAEMVTHLLVAHQEKASQRPAAAAGAAAAAASAALSADKDRGEGGMQDSAVTLGTGMSQRPARRLSSMMAALPQLSADTSALKGPSPDIIPSVSAFGTAAHALLLAAMELGLLSAGRYASRMGPQGCTAGIAFTLMRFLKAADAEVGAALRCAMLSFSLGLPEKVAFSILRHGYDLAVHRWSSYFFVLPWLHCTLAAVLWCIEKEVITGEVHARGVHEIRNRLKRAETLASTTAAPAPATTTSSAPGASNMQQHGPLRASVGQLNSLLPTSSKLMFGKAREPPSVIPKVVKAISTVKNAALVCPTNSAFCTREEVVQHANDAALRIMTVAGHLRHLMSVVHVALLLVRLLLRDLFMRRLRIEELMEIPLLTLLIPVLDLQTALAMETTAKDSDDEREKEKELAEQSIQDLTLRTPETGAVSPEPSLWENSATTPPSSLPATPLDAESSYMSGNATAVVVYYVWRACITPVLHSLICRDDTASLSLLCTNPYTYLVLRWSGTSFFSKGSGAERGGGSRSGSRSAVPLVPQFWKDWTAQHLESEFTEGEGYPSQRMTFLSYLTYVGETHLQSREVVEQLLLLVDHLIHKSQVCKFQLVDNGMPLVVHRICSGQTDNVYMMALSEMCSENLELKI
jgi:hypothetical protein